MILLKLFKNSRSAGMAGVIFLALGLLMKSLIHPPEIIAYTGMPFYNLVFGALNTLPFLDRIVALVFLLILCYMLVRIGARYVLLEFRSFMPAVFFLLFAFALPFTHQVSPVLVGSVFYLFCFAILFDVNDKPPDTFSVFSAGLILAFGSMFYLKLIWFLPLVWFSLSTMRNVTWRELLYPVIAYFLLGLLLFTWYWAVLDDAARFGELLGKNLAFGRSWQPVHFSVYIYYGFSLLLVLVASIYMVNRFQARKTVVQNIYQVLFYMFIAGILFFVFIARFDQASLLFVSFPVAFVLSNYFHRKKNHWIHELIMWILLGLLVYVQWMN
ncbi:MAG: DUF6427 family protein [Bacteroidota bacterium]